MNHALYDKFLNLLCAKRELRPFFESMPGVIRREKIGRHIQGRPKANPDLIKALYFKDNNLAKVVQYCFDREERPSTHDLVELLELNDVLQPGNPITRFREVDYHNPEERAFLNAIADHFYPCITTLKISMLEVEEIEANDSEPITVKRAAEIAECNPKTIWRWAHKYNDFPVEWIDRDGNEKWRIRHIYSEKALKTWLSKYEELKKA